MQNAPSKDLPYFPIAEYTNELFDVKHHEVEILDVPSRTWFSIDAGHIIRISKGLHIFMRRRGTICKNFDHHYQLFVNPPTLANIRTNLQGDRAFVRAKERESRLRRRYRSSDSEVEILDSPSPASRPRTSTKSNMKFRGRHRSDVQDEVIEISSDDDCLPPPTSRKRARVYPVKSEPIEDFRLPSDSDGDDRLPPPTFRKRARVHPVKSEPSEDFRLPSDSDEPVSDRSSPMPTSPIPTPSSPIPSMTSDTLKWPLGMYTKDLVRGMRKMDDMRKLKLGQNTEECFAAVFPGALYIKSTYYDARFRLKHVRQRDLDAAVRAGRTAQGRWAKISKTIPLRT